MICPAKSAQELLVEFRNTGSQQPFEEIVRRYAAMVFQVCFGILKNRHDAEDATQAVFLTLAVQGKTSKEIHAIGPWLQQVAKRLSLDLKKSRKRRAAREHRHGVSSASASVTLALNSTLDHQELRHILSEELNQLAPKYRLPLILHYFGGLSREQMSLELNCKPATLGVRLHRGREMLAARLSQRGVALSVAGLGLLLSYIVRDGVTESMVWSTSHAASQLAIGNPINPALISSRAMALARSATGTLAIAKIKGLVAAVLVAATAVAAGAQLVSKAHPIDVNFDGPAIELLRELLHPTLPRFHTDASEIDSSRSSQAEKKLAAATQYEIITPREFPTLSYQSPGAAWGGSTQVSQWLGSSTTTHIPGIMWSTPVATPESASATFNFTALNYAARTAPITIDRAPYRNWSGSASSSMARTPDAKPLPQPVPENPKPKRLETRPQPDNPPNTAPFQFQNQLAVNQGPKLYLDPAPNDARSHPSAPAPPPPTRFVTITAADLAFTTGDNESFVSAIVNKLSISGVSMSIANTIVLDSNVSSFNYAHLDSITFELSRSTNSLNQYVIVHPEPNHPRPPKPHSQNHNDPIALAHTAFTDAIPSSMSISSGLIRGYGTAQSATELNQSGQVIADGYGENRTLDLSAVGTIKNSISNPRSGNNGWFAQDHGKLVLPAVTFVNGIATWGEDSADTQLDMVNSLRLQVAPGTVGDIKLALLSPDRHDYPSLPANVKAVGIWSIDDVDFILGDVNITTRYDAALAADLNVANRLSLWGYDGNWHLADAMSFDRSNSLISGQLSSITYFAVGGSIQPWAPVSTGTPEPAELLILVGAGLLLARRRPRVC